MADRTLRAGTHVAAGVLILALTALFGVIGIDLLRKAFDSSRVDRETLLSAVGFGLNPVQMQNLFGITAGVILVLCVLTLVIGIGVLVRREGVRHAGIGIFVVFAVITIPLSVAGMFSKDEPAGSVWIGFAIGVIDAVIVYLLLHPRTTLAFERAEAARDSARSARHAERASRRASRAP